MAATFARRVDPTQEDAWVGAYLEKAKSLGGKMPVPPVEIPTGTFAWMQDPEGNTVGLWKTKK